MKNLIAVSNKNQIARVESFNYFNLADKWIAFAQVKPSSVKSYRKGIRRLAEYCAENKISVITRENMIEYRETLTNKYAATTANLYLTAAKLFLAFLQQENYIEVNPAEHLKGLKIAEGHKKDALTADDTKTILSKFNTSTLKGLRDKAIYSLMTTAGLRTIEVVRANIGDIVKRGGKIFLHVQGKGRNDKLECVLIADGVYKLIQSYLAQRKNISADSPLFGSLSRRNFGKRMTTFSISRIIKTSLKSAGYDSSRLTAHSLRHTAATLALRAGQTLRQVQQVLRHKNISVTQIYLHDLDRLNNTAESVVANLCGI